MLQCTTRVVCAVEGRFFAVGFCVYLTCDRLFTSVCQSSRRTYARISFLQIPLRCLFVQNVLEWRNSSSRWKVMKTAKSYMLLEAAGMARSSLGIEVSRFRSVLWFWILFAEKSSASHPEMVWWQNAEKGPKKERKKKKRPSLTNFLSSGEHAIVAKIRSQIDKEKNATFVEQTEVMVSPEQMFSDCVPRSRCHDSPLCCVFFWQCKQNNMTQKDDLMGKSPLWSSDKILPAAHLLRSWRTKTIARLFSVIQKERDHLPCTSHTRTSTHRHVFCLGLFLRCQLRECYNNYILCFQKSKTAQKFQLGQAGSGLAFWPIHRYIVCGQ